MFIVAALIAPLGAWAVSTTLRTGGMSDSPATIRSILEVTLAYCLPIALLSVMLGLLSAIQWYLAGRFGRIILTVIMAGAITTGLVVRNYAWIAILSTPAVNSVASILYTPWATGLVMVVALSPLAFFTIRLGLSATRPVAIDAARTLGATDGWILLHVVIGRAQRAIALAGVLVFAASLSYFITPRMLGGGKTYFIGTAIVRALDFTGDYRAASVYAIWLAMPLLTLAVVVALVAYLDFRRS